MSIKGQGRASGALAILAALTVGGGLALTGGPFEGRALRRDETRIEDLRRLSGRVQCLANARKSLPTVVEASDLCPDPARLADPFTDAPYRYERIDVTNYRVCAAFERPDRRKRWSGDEFDAERGCLVQRWYPDTPGASEAPAAAPVSEPVPADPPAAAEPAPAD